MNEKKYTVYKVTNRFDGKIYIGVHVQKSDNDRYMGSGVEIKEAIKQEGRKSFVKEILFTFETKEEMLAKEKELVTKEFCMRIDTYNRIEGGGTYLTLGMITVKNPEGGFMNVYNDDPRWLSGDLEATTKGSNTLSQLFEKSPELRKQYQRIGAENMKGAHERGIIKYDIFKGKHHNEEAKKKIGAANSIKQLGNSNSQYGTCWITKDNQNKKIKKENFDVYLQSGWIKGRK